MKTAFRTLAAALAFLAVPADAATLRQQVLVDGDVVRLGDIFDGAGARAESAVIQAPAPGRRLSFDAAWLSEVARLYQVAWRPQSRFDRVTIERAGRTVSAAELLGTLKPALIDHGLDADALIEIVERGEIAVGLEVPSIVALRNLSFDKASGRFSASLTVGGDHPSAVRVAVTGRTFATVSLPVLRRAMNTGDVIRDQDIEWVQRRADQVRADIVTDSARILGQTPRTRLAAGAPIRDTDTRAPTVVARNATVTIVLQVGNMTLTAQGRASEDGARGDTVRVVNLQSNKQIEATVVAPDLVVVQLGARGPMFIN